MYFNDKHFETILTGNKDGNLNSFCSRAILGWETFKKKKKKFVAL